MWYYRFYKFTEHLFNKILGLSPWTVDRSSDASEICRFSFIGTFWNILVTSVLISLATYEISDKSFVNNFPGKLMPLIIVKVIFIALLCASLIPLIFIINQKQLITVMNRLNDVDAVLTKSTNDYQKYDYTNIVIFFLNFVTTIVFVIIVDVSYFPAMRVFIENMPTVIGGGVMIQYAMALNRISKRFDMINTTFSKFGNLKMDATYPQVFSVTKVVLQGSVGNDIDNLKYAFLELCSICQGTSDFYGLSVLVSILCFGERMIFCVYLALLPVLKLGNFETLWQVTAPRMVWIIFVILVFTSSVTAIKKQSSNLTKTIISLRDRSIINDKIVEKLSLFSNDLLHLKIEFTACDIVPLDRTLLAITTGTITMYLIIAIQFAESQSSIETMQ